MVVGGKEVGCGTSPSKVYAKRERTADFLLAEALLCGDPYFVEVGPQLFRGLEYDAGHPEALGSLGISSHIIDKYGFFGADSAGSERLSIDERIRLAGAHRARVSAGVKQPEKIETRLHIGDVDRVGV